jgi:hypothetical protein
MTANPAPAEPAAEEPAPVEGAEAGAARDRDVAIWASMLRYLIRGLCAASRGEEYEVPDWICAHIVS